MECWIFSKCCISGLSAERGLGNTRSAGYLLLHGKITMNSTLALTSERLFLEQWMHLCMWLCSTLLRNNKKFNPEQRRFMKDLFFKIFKSWIKCRRQFHMKFSEAVVPSKAECWSIVQWFRVRKRKPLSKSTCRPTNWRESDSGGRL